MCRVPDRPSKMAHVNFGLPLCASSAATRLGESFCCYQALRAAKAAVTANQNASSLDCSRYQAWGRTVWGGATKAAMSRKLVWIEKQSFRGWGCSECAWVFTPYDAPTGKTLDEMMRNFELQRDKAFTFHVCADHSKPAK
jgi:hypothetical protein